MMFFAVKHRDKKIALFSLAQFPHFSTVNHYHFILWLSMLLYVIYVEYAIYFFETSRLYTTPFYRLPNLSRCHHKLVEG